MPFRIGTRGSRLALWQAEFVREQLARRIEDADFEIVEIRTAADDKPDMPLAAFTATGIFVKELERALLDGAIDMAVHSLKDLPLALPAGLQIGAYLERHDHRDCFVSREGVRLADLPENAVIGTSSARRGGQLKARFPHFRLEAVRGNVETRLRKLDEGRYDAIVLAAAGLVRLGLRSRITEHADLEWMLPEPGQGALAVEIRADDAQALHYCALLDHAATRACVGAERQFLAALGGGCRLPIAAYANIEGDLMTLAGCVCAPDGSRQIRKSASGPVAQSYELARHIADEAMVEGAEALLKQ